MYIPPFLILNHSFCIYSRIYNFSRQRFSKKSWNVFWTKNASLSPWLYQSWSFLLSSRLLHTLTTLIGRNLRPWRHASTRSHQKMWQTVYLPTCIGKGLPHLKRPTTRCSDAAKWFLFVFWIWRTICMVWKSSSLYNTERIPKIFRPHVSSTKFRSMLRAVLRTDCPQERRD